MKKIAIFQSDLNVGGIQKSIINLLNNMGNDDFEFHLFLFNRSNFYNASFEKNIKVFWIDPLPYVNKFIYFDLLNKIVGKKFSNDTVYDVAIDFNSYWNECALGAVSVNAKKRIIWIHNDVKLKLKDDKKYNILWHFFKKKFYLFDEYVFVSEGIVNPFFEVTGIKNKAFHVIPNIIDTIEIKKKSKEIIDFKVNPQNYNLVSMGRLCHQKGFDILIDMLAKFLLKNTQYKLYILGDGPDKEKLIKQIKRNKLGNSIFFLGNKKNPFPYLKQMDAFILASRYEGQGMVLWEAKALGLQIIVPKHLEKYTCGISGSTNVIKKIEHLKKTSKNFDELNLYNDEIIKKFKKLVFN